MYGQQDGYMITTTKTTVRLGISNNQDCCEDWGYLMSEDNLDEFIGATLHSVDVTDEELGSNSVQEIYEGGVMFVNLATSMGTLQFKAYNSHNGYYGHMASVVVGEETKDYNDIRTSSATHSRERNRKRRGRAQQPWVRHQPLQARAYTYLFR